MKIISCEPHHLPAIMALVNHAILNSTALYEYEPRSLQTVTTWFETATRSAYPIIGVENEAGELLGFASYGIFRNKPGYKYTVEHSIYVDIRFQRQGIGSLLLKELIRLAQSQNVHTLIGVIDAANEASLTLHRRAGFEYCGTIKQAGFKFGRWLDMVIYQMILPTPAHPADGNI